jgi:polar amino acid transport system substrate-binding protein
MIRKWKHVAVAAAVTVGLVAITGCAGQGGGSSSSDKSGYDAYGVNVPYSKKLRDMLPKEVIDKNKLVFSSDASQPPRSYIDDNGDVVGVIPDLLKAVAAEWNIPVEVRHDAFDTQVPGVQSGRFDATTDTADLPTRREVFDMVDFFMGGWAYMVKAGNPKNITNDPLDQCGLKVGLLQGGPLIQTAEDLSKECVAKGKPALQTVIFSNVLLSVPLLAGRIDVAWDGAAGVVYLSQNQPDKFAVAGDVKPIAYAAFGVTKENSQFRDALIAALQELIDNGAYKAIAKHWKSEDFMIDKITYNTDVPKQ